MKTVYIDVYFFINLCVDILALSISSRISRVSVSFARLCLSGVIGALYAVLGIILADIKYIMLPLGAFLFIIMIIIATPNISFMRRIKYSIAFFISQIVIGGLVYYGFCLLKRISENFGIGNLAKENRSFLILSIIVLLSYAVVKFLMYALGGISSLRNIKMSVEFRGRKENFDALVDSGNLAKDPSSGNPVVFVSEGLAERILGENLSGGIDINNLSEALKTRIRIIPVSMGAEKRLLYGFLVDSVNIFKDKKKEYISVTFAIDKKGAMYGGYSALIPAAAIDNVF